MLIISEFGNLGKSSQANIYKPPLSEASQLDC